MSLSASFRQQLAELVARTCGDLVPAERLEALAVGLQSLLAEQQPAAPEAGGTTRVVISVLGKDAPGIVAGVSKVLADRKISISNIDQTIVGSNAAMVMVGELARENADLKGLREALQAEGKRLGVAVFCQEETLLQSMYRVG